MSEVAERTQDLDNWINVSLEQMAIDPKTIAYGVLKPGEYDGNGVPLIRIKDLKNDRIESEGLHYITKKLHDEFKRTWLEGGEVLVSIQGTIGRVAIVPERLKGANISRTLAVIRPAKPELAKWILYFLKSPQAISQMRGVVTGSTRDSWNLRDLRQLNVPLAPPEQQNRIVSKIEELFSHIDAGIEALKKAKQLLKQYRQSVLKAAVTGELTKEWREENKAKHEPASKLLERIRIIREEDYQRKIVEWKKLVELWQADDGRGKKPSKPRKPKEFDIARVDSEVTPQVPGGWVRAPLAASSNIDIGFAFKSKEFKDDGIRLLRGDNIEPGSLRWVNTKYWPENKLRGFEHLFVNEGDVILAMDRPVISSGLKIAVAKQDDLPALLVQRVARISSAASKSSKYTFYVLSTEEFIGHCLGSQTGTQLPHISGAQIENYEVVLPPIAEQCAIVIEVERRLYAISRLSEEIDHQLIIGDKTKQTVLVAAFTGKLVESSPNDEDASSLLDRISAQQESDIKDKKGTKKETTKKRKVNVMTIRKVLDVLKESNHEFSSLELFEAAGYSHDMPSEKVEEFYLDLKSAVISPNVEVIELVESSVKQDNTFKYKA